MSYIALAYLVLTPILAWAASRSAYRFCAVRCVNANMAKTWTFVWRMSEIIIAVSLLYVFWGPIIHSDVGRNLVHGLDPLVLLIAATIYTFLMCVSYIVLPVVFIAALPFTESQ